MQWKRLRNKTEAKKLWTNGETIYLCPCNFLPGGIWHVEYQIRPIEEYKDHIRLYYKDIWPNLTLDQAAWESMYNNWAYYNTNYEMGYYAHYYIKE